MIETFVWITVAIITYYITKLLCYLIFREWEDNVDIKPHAPYKAKKVEFVCHDAGESEVEQLKDAEEAYIGSCQWDDMLSNPENATLSEKQFVKKYFEKYPREENSYVELSSNKNGQ